ncbi:MAG: helix-turn-helix transcriptional regulator [Bacilli bacterium]|nr:helix-turn-helix transcriptional regulator [Bacilli bacterium]
MKFGENLKLIRKSKKISQEELAEKLGVSRQSISKWETGENYPTMNNIICLCDIFNCKINELVHEDFTDINFLDDEIKMSVVKFKEKEQKRMKGLSKFIYVIARIAQIIVLIELILTALISIGILITVANTKFNTETNEITIFKHSFDYELEETKFAMHINNNNHFDFNFEKEDYKTFNKIISKSNIYRLSLITIIILTTIISIYMLYKLFNTIEKLFLNIHDNDTPFISENVEYLKRITLYLLLILLIPDVSGFLTSIIYNIYIDIDINITNYLFILILIVIVYIFKYGYEIQLDSKGKIYNTKKD